MIPDLEREVLLRIARDALTAHVEGGPAPTLDDPRLEPRRGGAFVTLQCQGRLRGCIGHIEADEPLVEVVARCAVAASSTDPRFPPVTPDELATIEIELSLLGPLEPIDGPADVEIGRHGLVVEQGSRRGLLLPQVATEWKWTADVFIAHTCEKAGLPADAWKGRARLWRFEAEVFAEANFERQKGRRAEGQEGS